eukprot:m51a1_g12610 hypothetical protein (882) ;mRNA; r:1378-4099
MTLLNVTAQAPADLEQQLRDAVAELVEGALPGVLCNATLPGLVGGDLSRVLANATAQLRPYLEPPARSQHADSPAGMWSLRGNAVVGAASWAVGTMAGSRGANWAMQRLTRGSGRLNYSDASVLQYLKLTLPLSLGSLSATLEAGLLGVSLAGLDTWEELRLLPDSADPYGLAAATRMRSLQLNASLYVRLALDGGRRVLYEEATLLVDTAGDALQANVRALVRAQPLLAIGHSQLYNTDCLLALLAGASFDYLSLNTTLRSAVIASLDNGDIEAELAPAVLAVTRAALDSVLGAAPALVRGYAASYATTLNPLIVGILSDRTCPVADEGRDSGYRQRPTAIAFATLTVFGALVAALGVLLVAYLAWRQRAQTRDRQPGAVGLDEARKDSRDPEASESSASGSSRPRRARVAEKLLLLLNGGRSAGPSLMCDPRVSVVARALVPVVILSDVALFISSNTSVGASVILQVAWQSPGSAAHTVETPALYTFGLVDTVRNTWRAGVYPLSVLVALFSGVWPYAKLVWALLCWVLPARVLSEAWRGRFLVVLDALGKWSLLDAYVMTIMIVAFYMHVPLPTADGTASVDLLVLPCYGFVGFVIATVVSLVLSHVILAIHSSVVAKPRASGSDGDTDRPQRRRDAVALGFLRGRGALVAWLGRSAVAALLLCTLALILVGGLVRSIAFEFRGAAGVALESLLNVSATRQYSLVDVGRAVPSSSPEPAAFGPVVVTAVYFLTALVLPALLMVGLLLLWCLPLSTREKRWGMTAVEVLNAWACIDVYMVSMAVALLELRQFAEFMVGSSCDSINRVLREYFAGDLRGHNVCFEVAAELTRGSWPLVVAIFTYLACTFVVVRVCGTIVHPRGGTAGSPHKESPPPSEES